MSLGEIDEPNEKLYNRNKHLFSLDSEVLKDKNSQIDLSES